MNKGLRLDIIEAWYLWLSLHHCGIVERPYMDDGTFLPVQRNSKWWFSYNRLSFIPTRFDFVPAVNLGYGTLSARSRRIYDDLCARGQFCDCTPGTTCEHCGEPNKHLTHKDYELLCHKCHKLNKCDVCRKKKARLKLEAGGSRFLCGPCSKRISE